MSTVTGRAALLLTLALAVLAPARATTMAPLTTPQLVDASDAVVRGTVTEVWTEPDAQGRVWTRASVVVQEVYKGDADATAVIVDQIGGAYGGKVTSVEGVARFSVGEEAVFFLETLGSGHTVPVGMFQGKYTVRLDPYSREEIVQRVIMPLRQSYDHRFLPLPDAELRLSLTDLEEQINARVIQGWDGQPIPGASTERLSRINRLQPGVK